LTADAWSIRVAEPGDAERLVLEAVIGDEVVGRAKTHHFDTDSGAAPAGHYLGGVSVLPEFRRRGIGHALTSARLDWIRERAPEAWFFTNARNDASIALHATFGFVEVARASEFHGVTFDGGEGILFRTSLR
jgi:aminoglycoside 6'-N-acetyltransferase I